MKAPPSVCLILPQGLDEWPSANLGDGFRAAAAALAAAGWSVSLARCDGDAVAAPPPGVRVLDVRAPTPRLFTGPGPDSMSAGWRAGYAIAAALRAQPPDLVVAPVAGGVAHSLLMARATGED